MTKQKLAIRQMYNKRLRNRDYLAKIRTYSPSSLRSQPHNSNQTYGLIHSTDTPILSKRQFGIISYFVKTDL